MSKTIFTDQFISEQKQIMDKFEAALCNYCIPGKENKEQCFIDFDKGRITAAQNYADALDEIKRLKARTAELEAEVTKGHELQDAYCDRIAELEGIIKSDDERLTEAGLKVNLYFGCDTAEIMAEEILSSRARIAELEAENKKAFDFVRKLRMYCIFANWDNPDTEDEFDEFDAEICKWLRDFMEPDK